MSFFNENSNKLNFFVKGEAERQKCEDLLNMNTKSQKIYKICKQGAYVSPSLEYANKYTQNKESPVVIMCRVDPNKIRIPKGYEEEEWITDGTRNTVRPYRILIKLNK